MQNNQAIISKLLKGLEQQHDTILQNTKQFYSKEKGRAVTIYYISRAVWDEESQKYKNEELFHSTSQLQIILFLRDLLYMNDGRKLPIDNEIWNKKRLEIDYYATLEKPLSEYLEKDDKVKD